ncbi:low temperature requirement protein A [Riemerella columbina]|uniref:low temperature requirement protein A n=1 Tax=Riemerella columbina TaxID=103810 RepID=UPI0003794A12|nr:low temperature requirement protein A [Riemerella columbina]
MLGRSIDEKHRAATPLELFFDLIFVIAIAAAARGLHHQLAAHEVGYGSIQYAQNFFYIWWAWMNYTWFASAYDTDDTPFRLVTFIQMFGTLVFAVGITQMFNEQPNYTAGIIGYIIMRVAMVLHWLRAAKEDPKNRNISLRYALGVALIQAGWTIWYLYPADYDQKSWVTLLIILGEMSVPAFAEGKKLSTTWHPHHIAERYGLLTIIVLGEGLLATANTVNKLISDTISWTHIILPLGLSAAALIFALWWIYFEMPWGHILEKRRTRKVGFVFGYTHYLVFASLAALGGSLELVADAAQQYYLPIDTPIEHPVSRLYAMMVLSITLGIYLLSISILRIVLIQNSKNNKLALWLGLVVSALPMTLVYFGLPMMVSLGIAVVGVIAYIQVCNWEKCKTV